MSKIYKTQPEGRGLDRFEDCTDAAIQGSEEYLKKRKFRFIIIVNYCNKKKDSDQT